MFSRDFVTYGVAKELARMLKLLTGKTIHHVNNSMEFADDIKKIKLEEGECIISYDVSALFTSIPVKSAIEVTKKKLEQDTELHQRTSMSIHNNCWSFVCVVPTSCSKVSFMSKPRGTGMESPVSPVVSDLYMEFLKTEVLHQQ